MAGFTIIVKIKRGDRVLLEFSGPSELFVELIAFAIGEFRRTNPNESPDGVSVEICKAQ